VTAMTGIIIHCISAGFDVKKTPYMCSLKNICVGSDVTQACGGWGAIRQIVSILRPDPELVGVNDAGFVRINISEWATG
ncbi:hypothetical protein, partial [Enterococcus faecalis]|uniref:hypothetical protein n=1 Tax=Enterococcus faecalis TaxID=1351 RepID=UPI003D6B7175